MNVDNVILEIEISFYSFFCHSFQRQQQNAPVEGKKNSNDDDDFCCCCCFWVDHCHLVLLKENFFWQTDETDDF